MTAPNHPEQVACTTCGAKNLATAYFCAKCGIGMELLLPPGGDALVNVRVGALFKAATVGGLAGVLSVLILGYLAGALSPHIDRLFGHSFRLVTSLLLWEAGPPAYGLGVVLWMGLTAQKLGYAVQWGKMFGGAALGVVAAFVISDASGKIGLLSVFLLAPFLSARLGLGFMTPWWPPLKLAGAGALILVGALLVRGVEKGWWRPGKADDLVAVATDGKKHSFALFRADGSGVLKHDSGDYHFPPLPDGQTLSWVRPFFCGNRVVAVAGKSLWYFEAWESPRTWHSWLSEGLPGRCDCRGGSQGMELVAGGGSGFFFHREGEEGWKSATPDEAGEEPGGLIFTALSWASDGALWAGLLGAGLVRSEDEGVSIRGTAVKETVVDLVVSEKELFALTAPPNLWFSRDGGETWESTTPPDMDRDERFTAFSHDQPDMPLAITSTEAVYTWDGVSWKKAARLTGAFWCGWLPDGTILTATREGVWRLQSGTRDLDRWLSLPGK